MPNLYTTLPDSFNEEHKKAFDRMLKRLRIVMLILLVSFVATVIWFSCTGVC